MAQLIIGCPIRPIYAETSGTAADVILPLILRLSSSSTFLLFSCLVNVPSGVGHWLAFYDRLDGIADREMFV